MEYFKIMRRRVFDEDQLLNFRNTWLLLFSTMLGALFSAAATLSPVSIGHCEGDAIVRFTASTIGLLVSFAALLSSNAALDEIDELAKKYRDFASQKSGTDNLLPDSIIGAGMRHKWGHALTRMIPHAFCALWLIALGIAVLQIDCRP